MKPNSLQLTPTLARRLAIAAQRLSGPLPADPNAAMLDLLRQIRCLQLDPIRVVERTQYLVLWSRLGNYDRDRLHQLAYTDGQLFEYWAHCASLVLTEDYPLHHHMMSGYPKGTSLWSQRMAQWVVDNDTFRQSMLTALAERGPLRTQDFENSATVPWSSGGWRRGGGGWSSWRGCRRRRRGRRCRRSRW